MTVDAFPQLEPEHAPTDKLHVPAVFDVKPLFGLLTWLVSKLPVGQLVIVHVYIVFASVFVQLAVRLDLFPMETGLGFAEILEHTIWFGEAEGEGEIAVAQLAVVYVCGALQEPATPAELSDATYQVTFTLLPNPQEYPVLL